MSTERPDEEAVTGVRRRRAPLAAASVAAAVLLAGGGAAYWAATAADNGSAAKNGSGARADDDDPPPLRLDGYTERDAAGIAPGEPSPNGGVTYRAAGKLPEGPGSAHVYRAGGTVTEGEVARLAEALGVAGKPRSKGTAWQVGGAADGAEPVLRVNKQAPGTWTFAKYGPRAGDSCTKATSCGDVSAAPGGSGRAVSPDAAKDAAMPVLKALGQDDAKLDARQLMGAVRVVNADPKVGGLPTYGWATGIQIGSDGQLVGGSGQLKGLTKGAEYPVISATDALKQLNAAGEGAGKVGIGGCATPVPHADGDGGGDVRGGVDGPPEAPCERDGGKKPAAPEPVAVGGAVFGLAAQYVDGRQALVPSWLFEVRPGGDAQPFTITHPAVDPEYLATPEAPAPREKAPQHIQSYAADGRKLTLHFSGGVCSDYAAEAAEGDATVKVRITEPKPDPDRLCVAMAKDLTETVTLDKPLGNRKVVDARSGETVRSQ
ncbi:hypothetical protein [Streptomyces hypolithicus]